MKAKSTQPEPRLKRAPFRTALLLGGFMLASGVAMAAEPDLAPKTVNIGEGFLAELRIMVYVLVVIAFLVANITLLMTIKDPSKLSIKYFLGQFVGHYSVDKEIEHAHDGIRELDNPMPAWLRYIFYASIVFAIIYMFHYHFLGTGPSSREEYEYEMAEAAEKYKDVELPESAILQITDAGRLLSAASIFKENCATCHGEKLEGLTGPNLTDDYWVHGNDVKDLFRTITVGVPGKSMISWRSRFSSTDRLNLASYILSLQGSNPPIPKAPEGVLPGQAGAAPDSMAVAKDSAANPK